MEKEELFNLFNEVEQINKSLIKQQASRDALISKGIREYPFKDYLHFEYAYRKWKRETDIDAIYK